MWNQDASRAPCYFPDCIHLARANSLYGFKKEANTGGEALLWPWICAWSSGSGWGHCRFSSCALGSEKKTVADRSWALTPHLCTEVHKIKMFRANRGTLMGHKGQAAAGHNLSELPLSFWPGRISCIFLLIELNPILLSLYFKIFGVFRITIIPS